MHSGRFVFSQLMDHLPMKTFRRCVQRYQGNRHIQSFTCLDQFLCMAFAQLTFRGSLRDIEVCLRAHQDKLYHMGIRGGMSRNTWANANQRRDWRIYAEFAQAMIRIARPLYADEDLGLELDNTVYALDASTVDLCLSVFPWALFRSTKSAVKLHTLLDLRGNIPTFIHVSDGKMHDVNVLDVLAPEPGAFYIMDRGYVDFERLFLLHSVGAFFIIRGQVQHTLRAPVLPSSRQDDRGALRPDGGVDRREGPQALSAAAASNQVLRCGHGQDVQLLDQSLRRLGADGGRALSLPLAGRAVSSSGSSSTCASSHSLERRRTRSRRRYGLR